VREVLILLGPPGVGKGTVGTAISTRRGVPLVSSGDLLREAVKEGTEAGRSARTYMEKGELVPDDIVVSMVRDRARKEDCRRGFILDGFPRTVAQAEMLDRLLSDSSTFVAVHLSADDDFLVRRLAGRRICGDCGAIYHLVNMPPRTPGICDRCGGKLVQRPDDTEEVVRRRLAVYREMTAPLLNWYRGRGILHEVPGDGTLEETLHRIRTEVAW